MKLCIKRMSKLFILSTIFRLSQLRHPFSLSLPFFFLLLSFFLCPVWSNSGVEFRSGESFPTRHTEGCTSVRFECDRGYGDSGLDFPMPTVNCWLYLKRTDLLCPLELSPGPRPRGCVCAPAEILNTLCVRLCQSFSQ